LSGDADENEPDRALKSAARALKAGLLCLNPPANIPLPISEMHFFSIERGTTSMRRLAGHSFNASPSRDWSDEGKISVLKLEQPSNMLPSAQPPWTVCTAGGISSSSKLVQPENASFPISVSELGKLRSTIPEHDLNAPSPTEVIHTGTTACSTSARFWNAWAGICPSLTIEGVEKWLLASTLVGRNFGHPEKQPGPT
jgi:hypothetical protein